MKAFILAAGLGTRLKPLTDHQPKVMLEVGGKKILEKVIEQLKKAGVDDMVINTHYFPKIVTDYFGDGSKWGVKIQYSFEPSILGTAGGVKKQEEYFKNEKEFLVVYGDNVYDLDFKKIVDAPLASDILIVLFDRNKSPNSGIAGGVVEVKDKIITGFYEGADRPEIPFVNGGIYKCTPEIFKFIPENQFSDFGKEVFPKMLAQHHKLQGYVISSQEALFGVDNLECLKRAESYFQSK